MSQVINPCVMDHPMLRKQVSMTTLPTKKKRGGEGAMITKHQ